MATDSEQSKRGTEYPARSGIRILQLDNTTKGQVFGSSWVVCLPARLTGRGRVRKQFNDLALARRYADNQARGFASDGQGWMRLSPQERADFAAVAIKLREHGITIQEAVDFACERLRPVGGHCTLAAVIKEMVASKEKRHAEGDLRVHSLKDFSTRSTVICRDLGDHMVHELTSAAIKGWAEKIVGSPRSRENYLRVLAEVLRFAEGRKYLVANPMRELTRNDRYEIRGRLLEDGQIGILDSSQVENLLRFAANSHPEWLGFLVLGCFCGLRTEELTKLEWNKVNLETCQVLIDASIAKARRIRFVDIPANAVEWLLLCNRAGCVAPATGKPFEHGFAELRRKAGFVDKDGKSLWPRNAMRHSFASHHLAVCGDPIKTSSQLGHKADDEILFNNYRSLVSAAEGIKYFAIRPGVQSSKLIKFKSEAGA